MSVQEHTLNFFVCHNSNEPTHAIQATVSHWYEAPQGTKFTAASDWDYTGVDDIDVIQYKIVDLKTKEPTDEYSLEDLGVNTGLFRELIKASSEDY